MRVSRLFVDQSLEPGQAARIEDRAAHYLSRVLRLGPGDPVVLFNGDGHDYAGEVEDPRCREVVIRARVPAIVESPVAITLAQAVGKGDRMDTSLQKSTELGVAAIRPLFTVRTEVRLNGKRLDKRMRHWQGVIIAACEQCGRAVIPRLLTPQYLDEWLASGATVPRLVLSPGADESLAAWELPGQELELLIGPEGGFEEVESRQFGLAGIIPVSLGPRVLRTESAGPAAIAVLQARHGDLA